MKCKHCGANIPSYMTICPNCGTAVGGDNTGRSRRTAYLIIGAVAAVFLLLGSFFAGQLLAKRPAPVPAEEGRSHREV